MFDDPTQAALWVGLARSGVRVACAACGLNLEAHPLRRRLCVACGGDVRSTQTTAEAAVVHGEERAQAALDALGGVVPGDGPLAERWVTYQHAVALAARGDARAASKMRATNARAQAGGDDPLDSIVRVWLDYTTALRALQLAEERAARIAEALV